MNKSAFNIAALKPYLIGAGVGLGVPMSIYTAGKLADIADKMGDINDTATSLKTSILPAALGAALLGGAGGGYFMNKKLNKADEADPAEYIYPKYNAYKSEFIADLIKEAGVLPTSALGKGLMAAIPASVAAGYFGNDLIDKATGRVDKELELGKLKLDVAKYGLPAIAALLGAGAGAATTYAVDKYSSYKDAYKVLILNITQG